ncbi:Retrotransposon gag protein [Ascosphaera apis ARSEF 7405]|uniref:Retrotransposon gag protein n=1 Tax=Ascosphaera apis ARSEF 7405 TaxID=392613 RepID=A0A168CAS1_9EURO|nr:Retrotransposon gag protein [Ascosphaera apis ARSEF 7405]
MIFLDDSSTASSEMDDIRSQLNEMTTEMAFLRQSFEHQQHQHQLPLSKIPHIDKYDGRAATYYQFETNLLAKMDVDGDAIGGQHEWVIYAFNRLTAEAAEKMSPWIRERLDRDEELDWNEFLRELCWTFNRERILQKAAYERLQTIRQDHRSVREYIWEFNEALRDSGDEGQKLSETMKMHLLERGLNEDIRKMFRGTDCFAKAEGFDDYCGTVYLTALTNAKAKASRHMKEKRSL